MIASTVTMLSQTASLLLSQPLLAALASSDLPRLVASCAFQIRHQHSAVSDEDELPDTKDKEFRDPRMAKIEAIRAKALQVCLLDGY